MASDDWPPIAVVIPDDIRELAADEAAYHREQRRLRLWGRYGWSGPLIIGLLVLSAIGGGLMAVFAPSSQRLAQPQPLAVTALAPGQVGGLLPGADLVVSGRPLNARELRPALLYAAPASCDCADLIRALVTATRQYSVRLVLVGHGLSRAQLQFLRTASRSLAQIADDETGAIEQAYGAGSLVFVHADGSVTTVLRNPSASGRYELPLGQLTTPHAAVSRRG